MRFQLIYNIFIKPIGDTETPMAQKSERLSDERIKPPITPGHSLAPKLKEIHNSKIA